MAVKNKYGTPFSADVRGLSLWDEHTHVYMHGQLILRDHEVLAKHDVHVFTTLLSTFIDLAHHCGFICYGYRDPGSVSNVECSNNPEHKKNPFTTANGSIPLFLGVSVIPFF